MSGTYSIPFFNQQKLSASAAFLIHAAVFLLGGAVFSQSAQYGIELGQGGMEVYLTAAPAYIESVPAPVETVKEESMVVDKSAAAEQAPLPKQIVPEVRGDGSSTVPGKDSTTLHTVGGAETFAQPNYLKNPAPGYPEEARRNGQEGVVMLTVQVDSRGRASDVMVKSASGYPLLDQAALKAVQRWKFKPAKIGSVVVESQVEIPVRFTLDKSTA